MWDVVDQLSQENSDLEDQLPSLQDKLAQMEEEVEIERKKNRVIDLYYSLDSEKTVFNLNYSSYFRTRLDTS